MIRNLGHVLSDEVAKYSLIGLRHEQVRRVVVGRQDFLSGEVVEVSTGATSVVFDVSVPR